MRIGTWIPKRLCPAVAVLLLFVNALAATAQTSPQPTPATTQTQPKAQITAVINPVQRKVLGNSVHPLANAANDRGRADSSTPMKDMVLLLHPTQAQSDALKKYVDDLHNPNSANFHKWLSPEQYAAQYGITDADLKTVTNWLTTSGFAVEQTARGKNWIRFSGTSSQVEAAFKTSIHQYSMPGASADTTAVPSSAVHYANATPLSIPAALAPAVTGVVSMNNFLSHPMHTAPSTLARDKTGKLVRIADASAATASLAASPSGTSSPSFTGAGSQQVNFLAPNDFAKIYNTQPLVAAGTNGAGTSIAIVGRSDINLSDVEAFRTIAGLPFNDPTITYATTDPGDIQGDDLEASLDVEWSGAVAPQAKINYVVGASTFTTDGVDISAAYIVDNVTAPILSLSFGLCEADSSDGELQYHELLWQQAASEGITVLVSSGDAGSSGCNNPNNPVTTVGLGVNGLASTAYNTAVGGTEFLDSDPNTYWNIANDSGQGSVKGYIPEATWNESCTAKIAPGLTNCYFPPGYLYSYAGGGGVSSCTSRTYDQYGTITCTAGYAKPSWQTGPGVPDDQVRDIPDVSLAAASEHDPYLLCYQGSCQWETDNSGNIVLDQATIVGGTSAAAPSMAGILALVEQKAGQFQGVANYQLYKLAAAQSAASCNASNETDPTKTSACVFNDITAGSNAVPCPANSIDCVAPSPSNSSVNEIIKDPVTLHIYELSGYNAGAGYDLASGLGSVNAVNLVNAWGSNSTLPSTTTLKLSQTTFAHGTPITFSGAVAPTTGTGTPGGDVILKAASADSSTSANGSLQTAPLTSGAFSASTINLPGGTYTLTADYSGDATYGTSASQPVSVTVSKENSVATSSTYAYSVFFFEGQQLLQQLGSTPLGRPFWIDVQIAGASGSTGATGTVEISNNGKSLGTFPLDHNGSISLQCGPGTPCDLGVGNYSFIAKYSGDNSFNPSTVTIPFNVFKGWLFWYVVPNTQTPVVGSTVVSNVYFNNDPTVVPTGKVTISRDDTGQVLGSGVINKSGTATISYTATDGTYNLIGTYAGDANYNAISQDQIEQIITRSTGGSNATKITLTGIPGTTTMGTHTQYSVTVAATQSSTKIPIGSVTLFNSSQQIAGTISLFNGKAVGNLEWDQVGAQQVYAVYTGDGNYSGGNSAPVSITVTQAQPTVIVQPIATTVAIGAQTSLTAFLASPLANTNVLAPTGTIQFWDSVNGAKAMVIGNSPAIATGNGGSLIATIAPLLATGSNVITAVYSGDANWLTATSAPTAAIVVTTPSFTDAPAASSFALTAGETATVSINTQSVLGFSAPITLSCGGTLPEGVSCASSTVAPGATGTVTLSSVAPGVGTATPSAANRTPLLATSGTVAFAGLVLFCIPKRRRFHHLAIAFLAMGILGGVIGCGGSSGTKSTTMVLSSANTKVASGATVTLQAVIQSQSSNKLQGTVTFYDGTTVIGSPAQVTNGAATLTTTSLPVGTHAIIAKYSGDNHDSASSSSNMIEQTVTGSFSLTINANAGTLSQPVTLPATLD